MKDGGDTLKLTNLKVFDHHYSSYSMQMSSHMDLGCLIYKKVVSCSLGLLVGAYVKSTIALWLMFIVETYHFLMRIGRMKLFSRY